MSEDMYTKAEALDLLAYAAMVLEEVEIHDLLSDDYGDLRIAEGWAQRTWQEWQGARVRAHDGDCVREAQPCRRCTKDRWDLLAARLLKGYQTVITKQDAGGKKEEEEKP